jgi:hypothetical protein
VLWTLGAAAAVFLILFVAVGWKLLQHGERLTATKAQLRESQRQRRRLGVAMAKEHAKLLYFEPELRTRTAERDDLRAQLDLLGDEHTSLVRQFQKLADKYSTVAQRLQEMERDPHYVDGCAKQGAFRLEEDALGYAAYLETKHGESMSVYPCKQCREFFTGNPIYHVGHSETRAMRMAAATRLSAENRARLQAKVAP